MIRTIFAFTFLLIMTGVQAQQTEKALVPSGKPVAEVLQFKDTEHDFGKIAQGKPVYYFFDIVNISDMPIKLDNVQASCGCTTPEWNNEPIAPGATGRIKVGYNAANEGYFEKPITVTYNGSLSKQIKIKGTVWKAPIGSAPVNQPVQFLKQQIQ